MTMSTPTLRVQIRAKKRNGEWNHVRVYRTEAMTLVYGHSPVPKSTGLVSGGAKGGPEPRLRSYSR